MAGFGDAAFRNAVAISNGHLIPRSLTLSFSMPASDVVEATGPDAYLRALMLALRRITELFDEDREVMHVLLADGLPEYLGLENLGDLLDAVPRYLRTTALPDVAVTLAPRSPLTPSQLVDAGCTRGTLAEEVDGPEASVELERALAGAGFKVREYRLDDAQPSAARSWVRRIEHALGWQPDQLRLRAVLKPGDAASAARVSQGVALLEQHGYVAGGADMFVRHPPHPLRPAQLGTRYCDLHGLLRAERTDLIGIGPGAISQVGDVYCQIGTDFPRWRAGLESGHLHVERGLILSAWERMVAETMQSLACDHELDTVAMEARHDSLFPQLLHDAMPRLQRVLEDGLARWDRKTLRLTARGKPFWAAVADCFRSPDAPAPGLGM
ncbi:MAG: coproporphyrinogen III oxidase [Stenotrophomonas sp.]